MARDYLTQRWSVTHRNLTLSVDIKSMFLVCMKISSPFFSLSWWFSCFCSFSLFFLSLQRRHFLIESVFVSMSACAVRVQNCPKFYNWWCVEMSIQTCVYGSFSSCLIKNFNEFNQKKREETMEMKPRKCIYNNATRMNSCKRKQWHFM